MSLETKLKAIATAHDRRIVSAVPRGRKLTEVFYIYKDCPRIIFALLVGNHTEQVQLFADIVTGRAITMSEEMLEHDIRMGHISR